MRQGRPLQKRPRAPKVAHLGKRLASRLASHALTGKYQDNEGKGECEQTPKERSHGVGIDKLQKFSSTRKVHTEISGNAARCSNANNGTVVNAAGRCM